MKDTLPKNIRHYRKNMGLTQLRLAQALFIAPQTVSKWESGISEPDAAQLCTMADLFGISLDSLVRIPASPTEKAMIAIDGGGTKTAFVLFRPDGEVLDKIFLGGTNPNVCGTQKAHSVLARGIDKLLTRGNSVVALYAGISGASLGENKERIQRFLTTRYPFIKSRVDGDIFNVINSTGGMDKCIGVISGTGSVAYAYDGVSLHRAGGWGYMFDEAGSGIDVGRDLLRYCLACDDGMETKNELYDAVCEAIGGRVFDNLSTFYEKGKDYIASFAPMVFEFYKRGNPTAMAIVEKTISRLAKIINCVSQKCDCGCNVVISGGLTTHKDVLGPLLGAKLDKKLRLIIPQLPPIYGAAISCMKRYGGEYDAELFERNFAKGIEHND